MRVIFLFLLLVSACCPTIVGPPGDASSTRWIPKPREVIETTIDCHGEKRGRLDIKQSFVTVKDCIIEGDVRIWGMARNANDPSLKELSHKPDYVTIVRDAAPAHVTIENCTIKSTGMIPLYVGPGSTFTTVIGTKILGPSKSTMVYLGAESYKTTIVESLINATQGNREAIAIDASDHNVIKDNTIIHRSNGGIYLYRNCGESGVIRHTTPSYNRIEGNNFIGDDVSIWIGSREGNRCYCEDDKGWPFGSSISDMDHARFNAVLKNSFGGAIKVGAHSHPNTIEN